MLEFFNISSITTTAYVSSIIFLLLMGAMFLIFYTGGWGKIQRVYKTRERQNIQKGLDNQSVKVGQFIYRKSIHLAVYNKHLYIKPKHIFRLSHSTVAIPLKELIGTQKQGFMFRYIHVQLKNIKQNLTIELSEKQALWLQRASNNEWNFQKLPK